MIIQANNYPIVIGENSLSEFNFQDYSQIAILVDDNTKRDCLSILLSKNSALKPKLIIDKNFDIHLKFQKERHHHSLPI